MSDCLSFPPVWRPDARVLILGSMPGEESLRQQQYYAYRHNAFWRILGELCGFAPALPYPERLAALQEHRIALWDVLRSCRRDGSLDSDIRDALPNDIQGLAARTPELRLILCNGGASAQYYRRHFGKTIAIPMRRLPSTSPAAAAIPYAAKLHAWREALAAVRA